MKEQIFLYNHNLEVSIREEDGLTREYCAVVNYVGYPAPWNYAHDENKDVAIQKAAMKLITSMPKSSLKNLGYEKE